MCLCARRTDTRRRRSDFESPRLGPTGARKRTPGASVLRSARGGGNRPMNIKVAPLPPQAPPREAEKPADTKLHKMALEFEAVFVRPLLSPANLGGHGQKEDG